MTGGRAGLPGARRAGAGRAVERAAELLTDLGHEMEEVDPPHDDRQLGRDFLTIWFLHQAVLLDQVTRETGAGDDGFEFDTRLMAALGRTFGATELQAAQERRRDYVAALAGFHARHDLLLTPTLGEPPIRIGALDTPPAPLRRIAELLLRTRTNVTGRPAISLPPPAVAAALR